MQNSIEKKAAWRSIIYLDSVHEDWQAELNMRGLIWVAGPVHDKDEKKDGSLVKPHRHLILVWPGPTTIKNALSVAESIGAVDYVLPCDYPIEAYKYLTHDENSNKVKYRIEDSICSESFSIKVLEDLRDEEEDEIISLIKIIIKTEKPINYYELDNYLENMVNEDPRLWRYCRKHTLYIRELCRGMRDSLEYKKKNKDRESLENVLADSLKNSLA